MMKSPIRKATAVSATGKPSVCVQHGHRLVVDRPVEKKPIGLWDNVLQPGEATEDVLARTDSDNGSTNEVKVQG